MTTTLSGGMPIVHARTRFASEWNDQPIPLSHECDIPHRQAPRSVIDK